MSVPDHAFGRRVQCPKCEHTFRYTGQKEFTLGRVRSRSALAAAAPVAARTMPLAPPDGSDLDTVPIDDVEMVVEELQTMPMIDLLDMPKALRDQFEPSLPEEPELIVDVEESLDLEMFHSTPEEMALPEISEAEMEALFLEGEPGAADHSGPGARSLESTLPIAAMQQAPTAQSVESFDDVVDAELFQSDTIESMLDDRDIVDAVAVNPALAETEMMADVVEEIEEISDVDEVDEVDEVDVLEAEEALVEVARIDPGETLPWTGGSPIDAPPHVKQAMATDFELGPMSAEFADDVVEEFVEEIADELDTIPPVSASPPPAAPVAAPLVGVPVRQASPVYPAGMQIAAALPVGSVPTAGVLRAHVVPGQILTGPVAPLAAPLADTLPYDPAFAAPASDDPIPPPTPALKAPLADDDLDAIFREVLGDGDIATAEAEAAVDIVEEIHELEPEVGFAEPVEEIHEVEPVVEELPEAVADDDPDLMALFADDPCPVPGLGGPGGEHVEEVEEVGFLFEDDPPAKK